MSQAERRTHAVDNFTSKSEQKKSLFFCSLFSCKIISIGECFDAVVGIRLSNVSSENINVDVYIVRASPSGTFYLIKNVEILQGSSLELIDGGSKIVLHDNDKIMAVSNIPTSLDVIVSYVDAIST